jgi:putative ABC transport system permease protein
MLSPRWHKVRRDLTAHKSRTALAVLSIAIGVFAVGVIRGTQILVADDLAAAFLASSPSNVNMQTFQPFEDGLVDTVRRMRGVAEAEGRRSAQVRYRVGEGDWKNMSLIAVPDFDAIQIDKVRPLDDAPWPPAKKEILVERSALGLTGAKVGDTLTIKVAGHPERQLRIAGIANDMYALLYALDGTAWAYSTVDTQSWLGAEPGFNELHVVAEGHPTQAESAALAKRIQDKVEQAGAAVFLTSVPEPGKHPLDSTVQAILLLLGAMGVLSLVLGALLVTNTIAALLAEETRYIGVMKAVGATTNQLVGLYTVLVGLFGVLALALALPPTLLITRWFAGFLAGFLNFDLSSAGLPLSVIGLQAGLALAVPVMAGLLPILAGTRITVREAIASYGLGRGRFGTTHLDRLVQRLRGLTRPLTLAIRNTFRRKGRLALTLTTLTLASAIFMAIFSIRSSVLATMDDIMNLWQFDVLAELEHNYRVDKVVQIAQQAPGIRRAEGWGFNIASWPEGEGGSGDVYYGFVLPILVLAPPPDTELMRPAIARGRWLQPGDENAVVVTSGLLQQRPGLDVGSEITLDMGPRNVKWRIVGVLQSASPAPFAYAAYPYFAKVMNQTGRAGFVAAVTDSRDEPGQLAAASSLEDKLERSGVRIGLMSTVATEMREAVAIFDAIVALLAAMAVLLAVVGGLALMGATSLNVIERTREIGVMRAIGASGGTLLQIFMGEAIIVGCLSWLTGLLLALPISKLLGDAVGMAFMQTPLSFRFSLPGSGFWLVMVILLAAVASFLPAWRATRVSVRESLAYE